MDNAFLVQLLPDEELFLDGEEAVTVVVHHDGNEDDKGRSFI
jgi:hypothetical protein